MPICKLCSREVERLTDCHLYPRALTRELAGSVNRVYSASIRDGARTSWANGGIHDRTIVCSECEAKFAASDQYFLEFRRQVLDGQSTYQTPYGTARLRKYETDTQKLYAFAVTTLLRWSLSNLANLARVDLESNGAVISQAVLTDTLFIQGGPQVSFHFFTSDLAIFMLDPYRVVFGSDEAWVITLPNVEIYIAKNKLLPTWMHPAILEDERFITVWRNRRPHSRVLEMAREIQQPNSAAIERMMGRRGGKDPESS